MPPRGLRPTYEAYKAAQLEALAASPHHPDTVARTLAGLVDRPIATPAATPDSPGDPT